MVLGKMKLYIEQNDGLSRLEQFSLDLLYGPLLSLEALRLYTYLLSISQLNIIVTYSHLIEHLQMELDTIESARKELERLMLLATFEEDNNHYLKLKKPLDYHAFKNHEVLGRLFVHQVGSERLQEIVSLLIGRRFDQKGTDISDHLSPNVLDNYNNQKEVSYRAVASMEVSDTFDMATLLIQCGETIFPPKLRTENVLKQIEGYATAYQIDYQSLKRYINESIPLEQTHFDMKNFKHLASINHQPLPPGDPFTWPPEKFLAQLQDGVPVINSDLYLIKDLKEKYQFSFEVINTLLDYTIKEHGGSLGRNLVEKIATSWKRAKVNSREAALKLIENEPAHKTNKKVTLIKKAYDEKPPDIVLDPQERQRMINKIKGLDKNEE